MSLLVTDRAAPLSAGAAAEQADSRGAAEVAEELASEAELGSGTMRALWRWAAYQVSPWALLLEVPCMPCLLHALNLLACLPRYCA